jgi:hypothetical protein
MMNLELLEESGSLSESQIKMRNALKIELMNILEEEETYWFKRSHGNWLLKGEQHRIFFHRVANEKKRKQTIFPY